MKILAARALRALALALSVVLWALVWKLSGGDVRKNVAHAGLRLRGVDLDPFGSSDDTAACPARLRVTVVYGALVWPSNNWRAIIGAQLRHLQATGLPACSTVHVMLSQPSSHPGHTNEQLARHLTDAVAFVLDIAAGADARSDWKVHTFPANMFEYPGLRLVWDLAREGSARAARSHLLLYFHSKGMVHHGMRIRHDVEFRLFVGTVERWRSAVRALAAHPHTDVTGMYPSETGYVWYNFWWARASYLRRLEAPLVSDDRFYYEKWLGKGAAGGPPGEGGCATCWSLCSDRVAQFSPEQAIDLPECVFPNPAVAGFETLY